MVGEIRDAETAKIAVNASLTGHLVLSTLHTNSAAGAIPRLLDLGVEVKVLPDALTVSMAQRLLRRLCKECKKEYQPDGKELGIIKESLEHIPEDMKGGVPPLEGLALYRADGCDKCNHTGYKGREGIFEAVLMDERVTEAVLQRPSEHDIWRAAEGQGLPRMKEHGILKVIEGITSLEELGRVIDLG